ALRRLPRRVLARREGSVLSGRRRRRAARVDLRLSRLRAPERRALRSDGLGDARRGGGRGVVPGPVVPSARRARAVERWRAMIWLGFRLLIDAPLKSLGTLLGVIVSVFLMLQQTSL